MLSIRRLLSWRPEDSGPSAAPEPSELHVRVMAPGDREQVLRIESASHPNAWPAEALDGWLAKPFAAGCVLVRAGECVGFFIVLLARDHLYLANLAVAPGARRSGVGTLALQVIEDLARAGGRARVELDVRETNLAAQLLYRKCGYRAVEVQRKHYRDQDGYRMVKSL